MTNTEKYINAIADLYNLKENAIETLKSGSDQIETVVGKYFWCDVESAINHYYVYISDKSRPRIAQINAILATWERNKKIMQTMPVIEEPVKNKLPTTNLFVLKSTFTKMLDILVKCGILEPENPEDKPATPTHSLIDKNGLPVLAPQQWLKWQVNDAMKMAPDIYAKYPNLTFWEQLAVGLANKLIVFRVRDWGQYAEVMAPQRKDDPVAKLASAL